MLEEPQTSGKAHSPEICQSGHAGMASARLFLCARCRTQALICSCCDRGHIYCSASCSGQSRREKQMEAARRSRTHPEARQKRRLRNQRFRERRKTETHQGPPASPPCVVQAPDIRKSPEDDASNADPRHDQAPRCHWCGRLCRSAFRQDFIWRRNRRRIRAGHTRNEIKAHGYVA